MCCQIIEEVLSLVEILEMDLKVLLNLKLHIMPFLLWRKYFVVFIITLVCNARSQESSETVNSKCTN